MSDANRGLERNLELATKALSEIGASRAAQGTENKYGAAYQQLVKAGLRPQLRRKYRTLKG